MKKFLIVFLLLLSIAGNATHNRAGEIVFKRIDDNPNLYEITVITYTRYIPGGSSPSNEADRCELELFLGHGNPVVSKMVRRSNNDPFLNINCENDGGSGVQIAGTDIKRNEYTTTHEFPGPGTYRVWMEDPNRNANIVNMTNSVNIPFYIQSWITIDQRTGGNNAPELQNPPIDNACVGQIFEHNPGAVDPDGDSLVYSLIPCKGVNGTEISSYQYPNEIQPGIDNQISINPRTGELIWDSPQSQGEYNICIKIEEYRRNPLNGNIIRVGVIERDMQIDVGVCINNTPPFITVTDRACVTAGQTIARLVQANDEEDDRIKLSAVGYPFDAENGASFNGKFKTTDTTELSLTGDPIVESLFEWTTRCDNIQLEPFFVYFKAKEVSSSSIDLVDFETLEIEVKAPAVQITKTEPLGDAIRVVWEVETCDGVEGYDIYRFNDSTGYIAPPCVTGVPEALGYVKIGSTNSQTATEFIDDNDEEGLVHGQRYCYMIVTRYANGSISYPSFEACQELTRNVPILNKVSVIRTDSVNGADSVSWYKPLASEFDSDRFGPPYRYELSRSTSARGPYETVYTSEEAQDYETLDTVFFDEGLNTTFEQYFYRIHLLSGGDTTGRSRYAASIYLTSEPNDNRLKLSWNVNVPWTNDRYVIYRFLRDEDLLNVSVPIDTVTGTTYTDFNLANEVEYRYYIRSIGRYSSQSFPDTLYNKSQIHVGIPRDVEAPCAPEETYIDGDCDLVENFLRWENPNISCDSVDDVVQYNVYYSPVLGQPLELIETITDPNQTEFRHAQNGSIAGCYAITAIDSFENESEFSASLCVDNCPIYELPNVFTPGNDGVNDLLTPFPYKFVESVSIQIFSRWGELVFETEDPDINWDGTRQSNGEELSDGVYYYDCTVNEIRLTGIEPRKIQGYIHLIRQKDSTEQPK